MNKQQNTIEIVPAIDLVGGRTVRLCQGDFSRMKTYDQDPVELVKRFTDAGFKRIHVVDLDGARISHPVNLHILESMAKAGVAKIEWSGGIRDTAALESALCAGAAYVVAGSVAVRNPDLFEYWLERFGAERIIFGADILAGKLRVSGWQESTDAAMAELIDRFIGKGLKRTICTDISCDGTLQGPSVSLYGTMQRRWPDMEITVSGGVGDISHISTLAAAGLGSVIVGKALYENRISLRQLAGLHRNPFNTK